MLIIGTDGQIKRDESGSMSADEFLNWLQRMHDRPAYKRMVATARPNGMLNPPEPLPDAARPPPR